MGVGVSRYSFFLGGGCQLLRVMADRHRGGVASLGVPRLGGGGGGVICRLIVDRLICSLDR